jgi:hypothetical protein
VRRLPLEQTGGEVRRIVKELPTWLLVAVLAFVFLAMQANMRAAEGRPRPGEPGLACGDRAKPDDNRPSLTNTSLTVCVPARPKRNA